MINIEKIKPTGLFTNYIYKAIPLAFDESMSYYETLLGLLSYLKNTVIPTLNNNADAIIEVQNLMQQLQNFVDNYFNNLDVQQEINNKLDEMVTSGELKSIINNEVFSDLNNRVLQNTVDINNNSEEVKNSVKQGQTNSITMNMLTQDVKDAITGGSVAVVGSDSINDSNIQNKAISIFKLDDYLQSTKSISYGEPLALGGRFTGFIKNYNGKADVDGETGTTYGHYVINLTKDKIYAFTGYNLALSCGILVVDDEENIIYDSNPNPSSSSPITPTSLIFKVNQTGLKAYLSILNAMYDDDSHKAYFQHYNSPSLREVENFTNSFKKITPKLIKKMEGTYASILHDDVGLPLIAQYESSNEYLYEMVKGMKYKIIGYDWSQVSGIYILGLDNSIIYQSSTESVGNNYIEQVREFTAEQDGYILLFERGNYHPSIEIIYDLVDSSDTPAQSQNIGFSKWYALGDSLTEVNFRSSSNYVKYITDELGIQFVNLGHSSSGYMNSNSNNQNFRTEIEEISGYNYESDIITVMGSINDFQYIDSHLGQLGDTGTDTIYGCIYNFFESLFTKYIGVRIGVILPPPTGTYHTDYNKYTLYNNAIKETAKLYSVPILDLSEKSNLKPWIKNFRNTFFSADGTGATGQVDDTHPNSKGHWLIHNQIKEFIKTL